MDCQSQSIGMICVWAFIVIALAGIPISTRMCTKNRENARRKRDEDRERLRKQTIRKLFSKNPDARRYAHLIDEDGVYSIDSVTLQNGEMVVRVVYKWSEWAGFYDYVIYTEDYYIYHNQKIKKGHPAYKKLKRLYGEAFVNDGQACEAIAAEI